MAEQWTMVRVTETSAGRFTFEGTLWNDQINGGGDVDQIFGYGGDDRLFGNGGDDTINGGNGADTIGGGAGNDTIDGGAGDDGIDGGAGNDTIKATSGVDTIAGGAGNDTITVTGGDLGYDRVDGGTGNDTITLTGTKVIVNGGSGDDTINTDLSKDTLLLGGSGSDRFVITGAHPVGGGSIAQLHGGDAIVVTTDFLGIESIASVSQFTDTSVDTLDVSQLTGYGGLTANLGTGVLLDDVGVLLANMTGIENVVGGALGDTVTGNGVANEILGLGGNDTLNGGGGNDWLEGGNGIDTLNGGAQNDKLFGGIGNDILNGGANDDVLNGGADLDRLTGGAGTDRFVFTDVARVFAPFNGTPLPPGSTTDLITDFDTTGADQDKIDLSAFLNTRANFNGTAQQAINQGYVYFVQTNNGSTMVMADLNGGGHTDMVNNFAVVELLDITPQEMRADLLITFQSRGGAVDFTF